MYSAKIDKIRDGLYWVSIRSGENKTAFFHREGMARMCEPSVNDACALASDSVLLRVFSADEVAGIRSGALVVCSDGLEVAP